MKRQLFGVAAAVAAMTVTLAPALTTDAVAAGTGQASRVITSDFPDPGFATFGKYYYLYKTGGSNIGVSRSTKTQSGYSSPTVALANGGSWVSKSTPKIWAPDVFKVKDGLGKPFWVMYYTAIKAGTDVHCIGVATSRSPFTGFKALDDAQHPPVCADNTDGDHEAIDPAMVLVGGKRYLVYKADKENQSDFKIRARPMDTATGTVSVGAARTLISTSNSEPDANKRRIEAPSLIVRDGKVWLFASRANYADCTYYTQAYRADSLFGKYTSVRTVLSKAKTGLCGPGGATVFQDGSTTRIAFHAWTDGTPSSKVRVAWVGILNWDATGPVLY